MQNSSTTFNRFRQPVTILLAGVLLFCLLAIGWVVGPIPQDPLYHEFADQRTLFGIPHAFDVISNATFWLAGIIGIFATLGRRERMSYCSNLYLAFFVGVFLTGFGSAFYHFNPTNSSLLWDRLPMALAFMGILAALLAERVNPKIGQVLFPWLVSAGLASVLYWHWQDDLRPYLLVQFGSIAILPLLLMLFPRPNSGYLWIAIACYVLAKVFETYDTEIFAFTAERVSGHTLKHLAAAMTPLLVAMKIQADIPRYRHPA